MLFVIGLASLNSTHANFTATPALIPLDAATDTESKGRID
jgi:hypothetical protein